mgnify:CR=1 FL=1
MELTPKINDEEILELRFKFDGMYKKLFKHYVLSLSETIFQTINEDEQVGNMILKIMKQDDEVLDKWNIKPSLKKSNDIYIDEINKIYSESKKG